MDIIFFAAIAIFIFLKLRSQFGKVDEDQKREAIKKFLKEQTNTQPSASNENASNKKLYAQNAEIIEAIDSQSESIFNKIDPKLKEDLKIALDKSKVSASNFIKGANTAFEMVIEGFCKENKQILQNLLSEDLANKFLTNIDERNKNKETLSTNIISIDESLIKSAHIENNKAIISVNFISQQIIYTLDSKQNIINGSKDEINEVSDLWTFSRDIDSKNPNWTIISTKHS